MTFEETTKENNIAYMNKELNLFIEKLQTKNLEIAMIEKDNDLYNYYLDQTNNIINFYTNNEVLNFIYNSKFLDLYINTLKNIKVNKMYFSDVHGLSHTLRSSLFVLLISTIEDLTEYEFNLLLISIIYHDIGRENDIDDKMHGSNSAKKLKFLEDELDKTDLNIIKIIITCHSLEDVECGNIINLKNINNENLIKKLLFIIKDADALDRVREEPYCDIKYLRYGASKKLLPFACVLYNSYKNIKE